jgi:hypothetical protein
LIKDEIRQLVKTGVSFDQTNLYDKYLGSLAENPGLGDASYISETQLHHFTT